MTNNNNATPKGVVFARAVDFCIKNIPQGNGKIIIFSQDSDYFSLGKSIKDKLEENNEVCDTLVLDDDIILDIDIYSTFLDFTSVKTFIVVGKEKLINFSKYFAEKNQVPFFAIPTEITLLNTFSTNFYVEEKGIKRIVNGRTPNFLIVDLVFFAGLKKQVFADGFCQLASKLVALIDLKANCILKSLPLPKYFNYVYSQIEELAKIDKESEKNIIKIINAQLRVSVAVGKEKVFLNGDENAVSFVLNCIKNCSVYEAEFFANKPIIKLDEAFLRFPIYKTQVVCDYNSRINELALLCDTSKYTILKSYEPYSYEEIKNIYSKLKESDILSFIISCRKLLKSLNVSYSFIYKGKQKRADFDYAQLKRSLILAPYLSNGLLKVIGDSGVLECLE